MKESKELRMIIAGGRDFTDYAMLKENVKRVLLDFVRTHPCNRIKIISGHANGADKLGERFSEEFGLEVIKLPANWDKYGKQAGILRNIDMAKYAVNNNNFGVLVAFWDGTSKGTKHMIDCAKTHGLEVHVISY